MSADTPLVSVVIPVHDVVDYLDACLDSVQAQTHPHLEVILVDDGSTDGSGLLCDERASRDPRMHVIHQENRGPGHARNVGIARATGSFVTFLDSDDWWHPHFVATLVRAVADHPGAGTAMCSFERVPGTAYDAGVTTTRVLSPEEAVHAFAGPHHSLYVIPCAKLFRRELLTPDIFPVGRLAEDAFTTHRLLMGAPVVLVPDPLYLYRQRPNSIMSQPFTVSQQLDEVEGSESMGEPGTATQYAALARQSRSTRRLPRQGTFRALATVARFSPRLAVAIFTSFASSHTRWEPEPSKRIALTFDDGPAPGTAQLVRYLVEQSAGATFFLRGDRCEERPDVVRLLHSSPGIEIGTHSHTHPDLHHLDAEGIRVELVRRRQAIESITGATPTLFRPPMGHRNGRVDAVARQVGQPVVLWSLNSMDFKDHESATTQVLAHAQDGDVVLLHDTFPDTLARMQTLVPALRSRGFELVTASALLGDLTPGVVYRGANSSSVRLRRWGALQRLRVARRAKLLRPWR